jgi:selenocysteine-specific elongation factor
MAHTVIGTAGHIDHGKTLLVKCLTGEETDRTPQEKARGITIELGFAFLGDEATIIDVPGHERFVKTMVAGVSSIDLALFVIAADDGVMPQSREHLDILELLGVTRGIIVLNKVDLAEEEWLEMVEGDIGDLVEGTFLERADIHRVSALSGQGIDDLQRAIQEMITETRVRQAGGLFRMPVDRSFLIKGFGLVCTGTVLSGSLGEGDSAEMLPVGRRLRARGLQRHGQAVPEVGAGDRAAINVPGVEQADAGRGQVIVADGVFEPTHMVDVRLKLLPSCPKPVQQRSRVRFHLGTAEVLARVVLLDRDTLEPGDEALAQLRLESPVVAVWGDRFVMRRYSPALTIGGGRILDPHPPKHRPSSKGVAAQLQKLESEEIDQVVEARLSAGVAGFDRVKSMAGSLGLDQEQMELIVGRLAADGRLVRCTIDNAECLVHGDAWQELVVDIEELLQTFHSANPLKEGLNREDLRHQCGRQRSELFDAVLSQMSNEGAVNLVGALVRSARHQISFSQDEERLRSRIEEELKSADFGGMPDSRELSKRLQIEEKAVAQLLRAMQSLGSVIYLDETLFLHSDTMAAARTKLRDYLEVNTGITVSQFRELINSNRKYALALLNRFDSDGFTQRQEDVRILR